MPTRRKSSDKMIGRERFDALTDEDIARQIAEDPDLAPEMTEQDLKRARVVRPARPVEPAQ